MTGPLKNDPPRPAVPETRIESLEEIQRAVAARQKAARAGGADADTQPFRPLRRPDPAGSAGSSVRVV